MDYSQQAAADKSSAEARNYAGAGRAAPPRDVPSGDTLTGQMMHLDELIKGAHEILARISMVADALVPDNTENGPAAHSNAISKIAPGPESGPLLFRLQNRSGELHALQSQIHRQLSRIDQVL